MKILKQCFQMLRSLLIRKCMIIVTFASIRIKVLLCFILAVFLKKRMKILMMQQGGLMNDEKPLTEEDLIENFDKISIMIGSWEEVAGKAGINPRSAVERKR